MNKSNTEFFTDNDEEIVYEVRMSNIRMCIIWIFTIIVTVLFFSSLLISEQPKLLWRLLLLGLMIFLAIKAIKETLNFYGTQYIITNKKVVYRYNLMRHYYKELRLDKIENIAINQSFLGRIFNYGNVYIQGANMYSIHFKLVYQPEDVKRKINELLSD